MPGALTLAARKTIYKKIKKLELIIKQELISNKELFVIKEEWKNAELLENMTKGNIDILNNELVVKNVYA